MATRPLSASFLSAAELARAYRNRERSPVEVVQELLRRVERLDPALRTFITLTPDLALEQARAAEIAIGRGEPRSPIDGVPFGIKDLFDLAGTPCTAGSKILAHHVPERDAFVVERLRAAGAVFLGKQNLHEFAYGLTTSNAHWGTCRNPWDRARVPGGSTGGGGAALAAGLCALALGTDTGGSIRIPSAACGVVGFKPTFGRVSRRGVFPLAWTLDHAGPMARTVVDVAHTLQAIAGADAEDPWCAPVETEDFARDLGRGVTGMRLGVLGPPLSHDVQPGVAAAVAQAVDVLVARGAERVQVDAAPLRHAYTAFHTLLASEASAIHERWMRARPADYGPPTRQALALGYAIPAVDYVNARREQERVRVALAAMLRTADVLVLPTLPRTAPPIGEPMSREPALAWNRLVAPFNLGGLPALTVPCGFDADGLPIGLQIVGRAFDDATVLRVGAAYERETEWHVRRPPDLE